MGYLFLLLAIICNHDDFHITGNTQHITTLPEDQAAAIGNMHREMVKTERVVPEICLQTDRQTDRHTERHTDRQTDTQTDRQKMTDRHAHHNTLLPCYGQSNAAALISIYIFQTISCNK